MIAEMPHVGALVQGFGIFKMLREQGAGARVMFG